MSISDALTTEFVGFGPVLIRNSIEEFLSVDNSVRDVTSAGKHGSPCIFIPVLDCVCIQNQVSKIILDVDVHTLACFDKGVEECGYFCTGLCNIEEPVLLANTERSDCILSSLVAACGKRIIKESYKTFPPVQRILTGNFEFPGTGTHILNTEIMKEDLDIDYLIKIFQELDGYKDSSNYLETILYKGKKYRTLVEEFESGKGDWFLLHQKFVELGNYKKAPEYSKDCILKKEEFRFKGMKGFINQHTCHFFRLSESEKANSIRVLCRSARESMGLR